MTITQLVTAKLIALGIALAASTALAAEDSMPLTYDVFEVAVPHADLADCPGDLAGDNRFCRATLNHEELHVFAFADDGDQPLVGYGAYALPAPEMAVGQ